MNINGIEHLIDEQIIWELSRGVRFVVYQYCISLLVVTLKRPSAVYFIRPGQSAVASSLPYTLLSLLFGWWGIPWGPVYTIQSFIKNFQGGIDVTLDIRRIMQPHIS